jgi:hypothetical protein
MAYNDTGPRVSRLCYGYLCENEGYKCLDLHLGARNYGKIIIER